MQDENEVIKNGTINLKQIVPFYTRHLKNNITVKYQTDLIKGCIKKIEEKNKKANEKRQSDSASAPKCNSLSDQVFACLPTLYDEKCPADVHVKSKELFFN